MVIINMHVFIQNSNFILRLIFLFVIIVKYNIFDKSIILGFSYNNLQISNYCVRINTNIMRKKSMIIKKLFFM